MKTKKCSSCPNVIDTVTHTCNPASNVTYQPNSAGKDQIVLTPPQNATDLQNYLNTPGTLCPTDKPFATSTGCIACTTPKDLFNLTSKTCTSCSNGYDVTTHACKPSNITAAPSVPFTDSKPRVILSGNLTKTDLDNYYSTNGVQCPSDKPFFDGKACIQCAAPTPFFDLSTKKCVSCDTPYAFSQDTQKC